MPAAPDPDASLADEHARLRARVAELEERLAAAGAPSVRYALDGRAVPVTSPRTLGGVVAAVLFLLGIGLGFGIAMGRPGLRRGFQDGMRNPSPGAEVPPPSAPPTPPY